MDEQNTLEEQCYRVGIACIIVGGVLLYLYYKYLIPILPNDSCVLYKVFGIYCPGCGGTRAVTELLHGSILKSLWYHPVVGYAVFLFSGFMVSHTLRKLRIPWIKGWQFHTWYLWGALGIVFGNWIVKNILLLGFQISL